MKTFVILHTLAAYYTFTSAYNLTFYGGQGCRSQNLGRREMKIDSGCQRDFSGNGASVVVDLGDNSQDITNTVVFFEGDDCNPSRIMKDATGTIALVFEDGCWTGNYGSYEVWDMRDTAVPGCSC